MGTTYDVELALERFPGAAQAVEDFKGKVKKQHELVEATTAESGAKTFIDAGNQWLAFLDSLVKGLDELFGAEGDGPSDTTSCGLNKTAKTLDETMNGGTH